MIKILFVCHGNICRSPMAEYVMKHIVAEAGLSDRIQVSSCATSTEEIGHDIYPLARRTLESHGIDCPPRRARQMTFGDYGSNDLIFAMDSANIRNMRRFVNGDPGNKVALLMSCVGEDRDIADPWYSSDFEITYDDVMRSCTALLNRIRITV